MRDLFNNVKAIKTHAPVRVTDDTAQVGAIIDRQGFRSVAFLVTATLPDTDGTLTPLLEESDSSTFATSNAVADADLLGTEALAAHGPSDDGVVMKLGYIGNKRYLRLTLTPADNTGNLDLAGIALLGNPEVAPQTDQSV